MKSIKLITRTNTYRIAFRRPKGNCDQLSHECLNWALINQKSDSFTIGPNAQFMRYFFHETKLILNMTDKWNNRCDSSGAKNSTIFHIYADNQN